MSILTRNWAFQSSPAPENEGDGDTELAGLENTTIEELEAEFNRLSSGNASSKFTGHNPVYRIKISGETPPCRTAPRDAQSRRDCQNPERDRPATHEGGTKRLTHDRGERPGTWDPADVPRAHQIF